jgi:hypothetical protein
MLKRFQTFFGGTTSATTTSNASVTNVVSIDPPSSPINNVIGITARKHHNENEHQHDTENVEATNDNNKHKKIQDALEWYLTIRRLRKRINSYKEITGNGYTGTEAIHETQQQQIINEEMETTILRKVKTFRKYLLQLHDFSNFVKETTKPRKELWDSESYKNKGNFPLAIMSQIFSIFFIILFMFELSANMSENIPYPFPDTCTDDYLMKTICNNTDPIAADFCTEVHYSNKTIDYNGYVVNSIVKNCSSILPPVGWCNGSISISPFSTDNNINPSMDPRWDGIRCICHHIPSTTTSTFNVFADGSTEGRGEGDHYLVTFPCSFFNHTLRGLGSIVVGIPFVAVLVGWCIIVGLTKNNIRKRYTTDNSEASIPGISILVSHAEFVLVIADAVINCFELSIVASALVLILYHNYQMTGSNKFLAIGVLCNNMFGAIKSLNLSLDEPLREVVRLEGDEPNLVLAVIVSRFEKLRNPQATMDDDISLPFNTFELNYSNPRRFNFCCVNYPVQVTQWRFDLWFTFFNERENIEKQREYVNQIRKQVISYISNIILFSVILDLSCAAIMFYALVR